MRIAVVGTGYVGLVSGVCFSEFGFEVTCVDKDEAKIARMKSGEVPIYEPGLQPLLQSNMAAGRLHFTTSLADALAQAEIVFIAVGTPSRRGDGHADLSYVYAAAEEIGRTAPKGLLVVTKSTVPVGTGAEIARILKEVRPEFEFSVASNPEFLREGSAVEDFMRPDRVVVGCESEAAEALLRALYRPLFLNETPLLVADVQTAEMIKYASNAFLATKIAFINEMADICEKHDADVQAVARAMGMDKRIGGKFLHPSPGFGGSCFPKDTRALAHIAAESGAPSRIVESVIEANETRKLRMVDKVVAAMGGSVEGKRIGVLGLTFKPNTDDMREAASLTILPLLAERGAVITAYDPQGTEEAKKLMTAEISYADSIEAAAKGSDALVILTEWNIFRQLPLSELAPLVNTQLLIDLRNIYRPQEVAALGWDYVSIGRPDKKAN
jgi:UDPglucose 6-dehydrogenase